MTSQSDSKQTEAALTAEEMEKVREVEILISNLLRAGVLISLCIVIAGMFLSFIHHPDYSDSARQLERLTTPGAPFPRSLSEVWKGLRELRGQSVIVVGLAFLIATPVLRVAVSIFAFAYQRDRTYVIITTVVLLLLITSFVLGRVEA